MSSSFSPRRVHVHCGTPRHPKGHLSRRLPGSRGRSRGAAAGSLAPHAPPPGDGSVTVIKPASRQPRGGTAADFHVLNRKQLQRVAFAEQVQVRRSFWQHVFGIRHETSTSSCHTVHVRDCESQYELGAQHLHNMCYLRFVAVSGDGQNFRNYTCAISREDSGQGHSLQGLQLACEADRMCRGDRR